MNGSCNGQVNARLRALKRLEIAYFNLITLNQVDRVNRARLRNGDCRRRLSNGVGQRSRRANHVDSRKRQLGENDGRRDLIRQSRRPRDVRFGASGERLSNNPAGTRRAGKRRDRGANQSRRIAVKNRALGK